MSKKNNKPRSTFDLSFNEYIKKFFDTYYVYIPDSTGKYNNCHTTTDFLDALDYAYGVGKFRISSDNGFLFAFNPDDYSDKDCKRAGFLEPFDFVTHNLLTAYELDIWKKKIREEEMY